MNNVVLDTLNEQDGILTITLNRPDKLNALNSSVLEALDAILQSAKTNKGVKGILITGSGKAFCAGADIKRLAECDAQSGYDFACFGQKVFRNLETIGKPSISAINGFTFGGGLELAMSTTLRIADDSALFGQPEVKLGVIPGYGGTQRLLRLVGKGRALDLCTTGRFIDAKTALNWGIISEITEKENLINTAETMLKLVLSMAPLAIESVIDVIDRGFELPLNDALHLEAMHFAKLCASKDKAEGVNAFLNKEKPKFQGL